MSKRIEGPRGFSRRWAPAIFLAVSLAACGPEKSKEPRGALVGEGRQPPWAGPSAEETAFLDTLQERTFRWFWDVANPATRLTPDRAPTPSFASVAATGFALTAYPIGAERGWVERSAASRRVLETLRFLWTARQDTSKAGAIGTRGLYYHFLDAGTGARFEDVELSTMDTALLFAGVLFCQSYFDQKVAAEDSIRALADSLYRRADWNWASPRAPLIGHGWSPEEGFLPWDWGGYNEAMLVYVIALGSPTHPVPPEAWAAWTAGYKWGSFHDQEHVGFAPLFGHQFTHVWIDFRGIRDATMREHGLDYFENSRRAVLAQHAYAIENPQGWTGYGPLLWGLSACDGPTDGTIRVGGQTREVHTYWARGASFTEVSDDGTICPSAVAGSIAFAPEIVVPTLLSMHNTYGEHLFSTYGFVDALNPTLRMHVPLRMGQIDPKLGWFDTDYIGIDQGPIVAMIENWRSGLVWRIMRGNPYVVRGLQRAGFTGGWLDSVAVNP